MVKSVTNYELRRKRPIPKNCRVSGIDLTSTGANLSLRCQWPDHYFDDGSRWYDGMRRIENRGPGRNYPSMTLRGVNMIKVGDANISGNGTSVGFVVSPRSAYCTRDYRELHCKVS